MGKSQTVLHLFILKRRTCTGDDRVLMVEVEKVVLEYLWVMQDKRLWVPTRCSGTKRPEKVENKCAII